MKETAREGEGREGKMNLSERERREERRNRDKRRNRSGSQRK